MWQLAKAVLFLLSSIICSIFLIVYGAMFLSNLFGLSSQRFITPPCITILHPWRNQITFWLLMPQEFCLYSTSIFLWNMLLQHKNPDRSQHSRQGEILNLKVKQKRKCHFNKKKKNFQINFHDYKEKIQHIFFYVLTLIPSPLISLNTERSPAVHIILNSTYRIFLKSPLSV